MFYSEALGLGLLIIVYFDLLVTCYSMLHLSFIDTELLQKSLAMAEESLRQSGMPADQVANAVEMQEMMSGPIVTPLIGFFPVMILGVLFSLITAIFMRRKPA